MRILADACVAGFAVQSLRRSGFEVEWVAEWAHDPGDRAILDYACATRRLLFTRDKDFGELIFRDAIPHCGVLRLAGEMNYSDQARVALQVLRTHKSDLEAGRIVTVEPGGRVRVSARAARH